MSEIIGISATELERLSVLALSGTPALQAGQVYDVDGQRYRWTGTAWEKRWRSQWLPVRAETNESGEVVRVAASTIDLPVVTYQTSPDGGSRKTIEGPSLARIRTGSKFWSPQGRYITAAKSGDHTTAMQVTLEPWLAIRFHIPNAVTAEIPNVRIRFTPTGTPAAAGTAQELAPTDGSWIHVTKGEAQLITLSAAPADGLVSWTATDWITTRPSIDVAGSNQSAFCMRIEVPAASGNITTYANPGLNGYQNVGDNPLGALWRPRTATALGSSSLPAMTIANSVINYKCYPIVVEIIPKKPGPSILTIGDSIHEGSGDVNRIGYQPRAAMQSGVNVWTQAIGGATMAAWYLRLKSVLSAGMIPTHCVVPVFSPNGTSDADLTQVQIETAAGTMGAILSELRAHGIQPIFATGIPSTPGERFGKSWGANDQRRRDWNTAVISRYGQDVIDLSAALSGDPLGSGQIPIREGFYADGLHPNTSGYIAMSETCAAQFARVMAGEI